MDTNSKPGISAYFRLFMASLFVAGGIGVVLGFADHVEFVGQNRMLVGIPFLLYGLLRLYLAIRIVRGKNDTLN